MNAKQVRSLRRMLIEWYGAHHRDLPWRKTRNPYYTWVAEVMLQQTRVSTVIPYYNRFVQRFETLPRLAEADLQAVLKLWEGLGYYARARNLHRAAGMVLKHHRGVVPGCWQDFHKLPGVGDYIAAAVLSIAFGKPYPVADGNVKRVLARLQAVNEPVNRAGADRVFRQLAATLLEPRDPATFNQAVMELGALVCRSTAPLCSTCPLAAFCLAYQRHRVDAYPRKRKKQPIPRYHIATGVVFKNNRVLITRRRPEGLLGGLWEFPGGKRNDGESAESACQREIREEVDLVVRIDAHLDRIKHTYTHFKIDMDVFCCTHVSGRVKLNGPVDHRWIRIDELDDYPLPGANHKFIAKLKQYEKCRLTSDKRGVTRIKKHG